MNRPGARTKTVFSPEWPMPSAGRHRPPGVRAVPARRDSSTARDCWSRKSIKQPRVVWSISASARTMQVATGGPIPSAGRRRPRRAVPSCCRANSSFRVPSGTRAPRLKCEIVQTQGTRLNKISLARGQRPLGGAVFRGRRSGIGRPVGQLRPVGSLGPAAAPRLAPVPLGTRRLGFSLQSSAGRPARHREILAEPVAMRSIARPRSAATAVKRAPGGAPEDEFSLPVVCSWSESRATATQRVARVAATPGAGRSEGLPGENRV